MKRKFPSKEKKEKVELIQTDFIGEPRPDKNKGLELFIKERIKFLKGVRKHQFPDKDKNKKQRTILKHNITSLEFTLHEWEKKK
jgi:hypothetical protein